MAANEAELEEVEPEVRTPPVAVQRAAQLQRLLRSVNREIARRSASGVTAAFVCECLDRSCVEAVEAPLAVFAVLATAGQYFVVRPEHEHALGERVVRRENGYVVVERRL